MFKIMVVEDDVSLKNIIAKCLTKWGHDVHQIENLENIIEEFKNYNPELVLLDINLPFYDGFHWCNEIRKISKVPIIFISSRNSNMDVIMDVNLGADDYIQKPFSVDVLVAKVNALLRRTYNFVDNNSNQIIHNGVTLDLSTATINYEDNTIELTKNEIKILHELMKYKGQIVSRNKLMKKLWDNDWFVDDNTLTVNVNRIRSKLNEIGLEDFIETKRGLGYIIS
ncbi:Glycopeptide resistance-associated protein R [Clostridioides difficile]|uniref:response regulator transcription factor n=1 Tax=Clostridioides difficile TaxID=1496 RepID=UPI00098001EF|nr:response regulator transcription factor [Clostridioides difficile]MCI9917240.1 response regulator transcription factor [Clostridioides difficile]MCI9924324.1 response regulator transcription factor [Clostridioides difficile]MCI9928629.1 response regulator transcription factor [Clostridioides difficile]SJN60608.1 Glycopeptide resistance-associated protein R [Clostridioides difficile]SJN69864.1 Glycopeptide resistance-associated protein R [Clostridioides difficile]